MERLEDRARRQDHRGAVRENLRKAGALAESPPSYNQAERRALAEPDTVIIRGDSAPQMTGEEISKVAELLLERTEALRAAERDASPE
jgi:hypothetical protein